MSPAIEEALAAVVVAVDSLHEEAVVEALVLSKEVAHLDGKNFHFNHDLH